MSGKSQLDLLVRVRYTNPLPPPPYPPKLLNIPTDPKRYARVEFTQPLSNEAPLPMVVDADCGMPLDLSHFDSLWDGSQDNMDAIEAPPIDPRDAFMLESSAGASTAMVNGANVSWLRKTEYISRESTAARPNATQNHDLKILNDIPIDVSVEAQLFSIEQTFAASTDISGLKHPNKKDVEAVEVYDFLPDSDLWPNTYDLIRFSERPGERPLDQPDPRLDVGLLRPYQTQDGDHFLGYYLTREDEDAEEYKFRRRTQQQDLDKEAVSFQFVRDYEIDKVEQDVDNEFILTLDDASQPNESTHEVKGAYYMTISRKIKLKKRRLAKGEEVLEEEKVGIFHVSHRPFTSKEESERLEHGNIVDDPTWTARMAEAAQAEAEAQARAEAEKTEADADGEAEDEGAGHRGTNGIHDDDMDED